MERLTSQVGTAHVFVRHQPASGSSIARVEIVVGQTPDATPVGFPVAVGNRACLLVVHVIVVHERPAKGCVIRKMVVDGGQIRRIIGRLAVSAVKIVFLFPCRPIVVVSIEVRDGEGHGIIGQHLESRIVAELGAYCGRYVYIGQWIMTLVENQSEMIHMGMAREYSFDVG
jgi:hypothetical protein